MENMKFGYAMLQNWDPRQNSIYGGLLVCKESWVQSVRSTNRKMGKLHSAKGLLRYDCQAAPHLITRVGAGQQAKSIFWPYHVDQTCL